MHIIYLHQYFNTPEMTGGTRSYELARRLVLMGHDVTVVTTWRDSSESAGWRLEEIAGIKVLWLTVPYSNHMSYARRTLAFFEFAFKSARKTASLDADLVFATSTPLTIALPGVYATKKLKVPFVFEVRDLWPELPVAIGAIRNPLAIWMAKRLESFAYRHAVRIVALSPGMKEGVVRAGISPDRVDVIPNSADLDLFAPSAEKETAFREKYDQFCGKKLVMYAGTLGRINGVSYLVSVAKHALQIDSNIAFVVIGDGAEERLVHDLAVSEGVLNQNFFMLDPISKHEISSAFCAADLVVSLFVPLPEMEANSANKFFDGLASGTPVAINYGGWQEELLVSHSAGFSLGTDTKVAATRIAEFLSDAERASNVAHRARELAEKMFSRDMMAQHLELTLEKAVAAYRAAK